MQVLGRGRRVCPTDHDKYPGLMRFGQGGETLHRRGFVGIGGEANNIRLEFGERPEEGAVLRLLTGQIKDARFVRRWNAASDDLQR